MKPYLITTLVLWLTLSNQAVEAFYCPELWSELVTATESEPGSGPSEDAAKLDAMEKAGQAACEAASEQVGTPPLCPHGCIAVPRLDYGTTTSSYSGQFGYHDNPPTWYTTATSTCAARWIVGCARITIINQF